MTDPYILGLDELGMGDVARVGGKNASLGEMIAHLSAAGVRVPGGFATTAAAFRDFLQQDDLRGRIVQAISGLDVEDVGRLAEVGDRIRGWIRATPFQTALQEGIVSAYDSLLNGVDEREFAVAVRSSATAEDLPDASFAGQQETFLNVRGVEEVLVRVKDVFASLFNDRAIAYRAHHGFEHMDVLLSAGIQRMVRSDLATSGVMFSLDTESGFDGVVFINAGFGLGETVVQGAVNPDEFYVYKTALAAGRPAVLRRNLGDKAIRMVYGKGGGERVAIEEMPEEDRGRFCLTDAQVEELARVAVLVEEHYARPMDIEWAYDGLDGQLYILQARPETVQSRSGQHIERYSLDRADKQILTEGRSIGHRIGAGRARVIRRLEDMTLLQEGDVLVTDMTDPDWEPVMKRAAAIITNRGGRTCHAAIIARELGVPAVVGCGDATDAVSDGVSVTVSCAEGDTGYVYNGLLPFERREISLAQMPDAPTRIMMNVGNPDRAFTFAGIPNQGVGLARLEFIINHMIGVHPRALLEFDALPVALRERIQPYWRPYGDPVEFFVARLTEGIASIGAAFAPHPVIVRLSDFKSNEYANLIGGDRYEPDEENPMLGFRGASRYLAESFAACFELECRALRRVRDDMGLTNVEVMVPFVRTVEEAAAVVDALASRGLRRGDNGLRVIMMCELPSNALLAEEFLQYFDGFSIGSNDLTQLTLGLDRDSGLVADRFDERNPAVKKLLAQAIDACRANGKYIGICGQGPSDHPDLAEWLVARGIDSVSLNPDTVVETWTRLAAAVAQP